jgi:hypothetical protein
MIFNPLIDRLSMVSPWKSLNSKKCRTTGMFDRQIVSSEKVRVTIVPSRDRPLNVISRFMGILGTSRRDDRLDASMN